MTSITVARFRELVPAFNDQIKYPDTDIVVLLDLSDKLLDVNRWGDWREMGQAWFAAHFITLNNRDSKGNPGAGYGIVNSKSVGAVSVGYDTMNGLEKDGGQWNLTTFGVRFLGIARMVGSGGVQLGGPDINLPNSGPAWPGVIHG